MALIQIIDLKKKYNERWITNGVTLTIPANQMTVIIGKSGEGKSVLLKQIIGLIKPTSGTIIINGVDITTANKKTLHEQFCQIGYVFQFAALLDSLTIVENIGLPLKEVGISQKSITTLVKEKLSLVDLSHDILHKYPSELSGGMRKRVGLARTLITNPKIILYDEPTTGLDPITSRLIHELMHSMQKKLGITSIVVSHDIEIFNYANQIALLYEGQIQHIADARGIWSSENQYIHQFIRGLSHGPIQTDADLEPPKTIIPAKQVKKGLVNKQNH